MGDLMNDDVRRAIRAVFIEIEVPVTEWRTSDLLRFMFDQTFHQVLGEVVADTDTPVEEYTVQLAALARKVIAEIDRRIPIPVPK